MTIIQIKAAILDMVSQLEQNPDLIASVQLSDTANTAVSRLIQLLILIKDSMVVKFIIRNAFHPIVILCEMGEDGLISTTKTIGLATKKLATNGAGVYV
jgi:hypothetical protein